MKRSLILVAAFLLGTCVRGIPDWYEHQDWSIKIPRFSDPKTKVDLVIDGVTLQALRVVADDFSPPTAKWCTDKQTAQIYRVSYGARHRVPGANDIIFVEVDRDPCACNLQGYALDSGGVYAINREGRILRRILGGQEPFDESEYADAGLKWEEWPNLPDGGPAPLNPPLSSLGPYFPMWMLDAGWSLEKECGIVATQPATEVSPELDAGEDAGAPDAGVEVEP